MIEKQLHISTNSTTTVMKENVRGSAFGQENQSSVLLAISLILQNQFPTASLTANIWRKHFSEVFTAGLIGRDREG